MNRATVSVSWKLDIPAILTFDELHVFQDEYMIQYDVALEQYVAAGIGVHIDRRNAHVTCRLSSWHHRLQPLQRGRRAAVLHR